MESVKDCVVREGMVDLFNSSLNPSTAGYLVRKWSDGFIEYYNIEISKWCNLSSTGKQESDCRWRKEVREPNPSY